MKTSKLSRAEIMRLPEGIKVKSIPKVYNNKTVQFNGILVFQPLSMQEEYEELFGIMNIAERSITFEIKAGNIIICDPGEIENPPLWIVRCQYFKAKKDRLEYFIIHVLDKKEDKLLAVTPQLKQLMSGTNIKYFQAKIFSNDIELVREIAEPQRQKLILEKD